MALLIRNSRMPEFKHRPHQFEQGRSLTLPAPYGGINLRSDITALAPNEARALENWFPGSGQCELRPGFGDWGTGVGSAEVKTLVPFVGYTASKLLAAGGGAIYDVTTAGAGTSKASGFSDDRWQTALYQDRLFFVNGTDNPQVYNGSTVSGIVWTGSGLSADNDLINIALVRNRLWFCEKEKAHVWYGAIGQITAASALTKYDLQQIAGGGICMAVGSWSRDAGDGADDMTVFVMSTGEIIIYQGDPGSTFTLIGKYWGAPPLGRQCLFKVGGELIVITRLGLLPVSAAVGGVALDLARIDPWGKIAAGIAADAVLDGDNAGWHGCLHQGVVYVNVPRTSGSLSKQWVVNTRNGASTTYTKWNASSLASFNNELYIGAQAGGLVREVGGSSDDGEAIVATSNGAFVFPMGDAQSNKLFTSIRPRMDAEGTVSGLIGVDVDFIIRTLSGTSVDLIDDPSSTPWGSPWGSAWGSTGGATPVWFGVRGVGRAVSVRMRAVATALNCRWYASDIAWKPGGIR